MVAFGAKAKGSVCSGGSGCFSVFFIYGLSTVSPIKLETGLRPNSAGTPYTLLIKIEAIGFPTFRLLL